MLQLHGNAKKVRDRQQLLEKVRDMKQLTGTGKVSEREHATMRDMWQLNGTKEKVRDSQQP